VKLSHLLITVRINLPNSFATQYEEKTRSNVEAGSNLIRHLSAKNKMIEAL
jgi:hypothetical protein